MVQLTMPAAEERQPGDRARAAGGAPRRVLLVTAAMGSGHVQVTREVARRLEAAGHRTRVVDLNDLMVGGSGRWLARLYPWMVQQAPWLYDGVYRVFFKARQDGGERVGIPALAAMPGLRRVAGEFRPDLVVSTYHIASQALGRLRAEGTLRAGTVTFVTTFGVHELWLHPATDGYLCISPVVAGALRERTAVPVRCCGPVVRAAFDPDHRPAPGGPRRRAGGAVALLVAGSLGLGRVEHAARLIAAAPGWRPVVVCGTNDDLRARLSAAGVTALGWVDDMPGLMADADVLVDNAGGLTSKEALAAGVPVVAFDPIPGHGRDDALAMAALGVSVVVDDERYLVPVLERVGRPGRLRDEQVRRGRELFDGDAATHLLGLLAEMEGSAGDTHPERRVAAGGVAAAAR